MEQLGLRKAEMTDMSPDGKGRVRIDFIIPSRGLIGFQTEFMTLTSGSGLLYHTFDHYGPYKGGIIGKRKNGVLIANANGKAQLTPCLTFKNAVAYSSVTVLKCMKVWLSVFTAVTTTLL